MEVKKTDMFLFSRYQAKDLITSFGIRFEEGDTELKLISNANQHLKCESCKKGLTLDNIGHIAHGSNLLYCDNPICFTHFVANKKLK